MCSPAPVVDRFGADVAARFGIPYVYDVPGPGGVFLGSVGDQDHQTRHSSHNCAPMQESSVGGVSYAPNYAHAYDARPINTTVGMQLVRETLKDSRVRYVNYDNVRYYPDGRTDDPIDHPTFHVSFLPGTHNDTRPFFTTDEEFTVDQADRIVAQLERTRETIIHQHQKDRANASRIGALARKQQAKLDTDDDAVLRAQEEIDTADAILKAED